MADFSYQWPDAVTNSAQDTTATDMGNAPQGLGMGSIGLGGLSQDELLHLLLAIFGSGGFSGMFPNMSKSLGNAYGLNDAGGAEQRGDQGTQGSQTNQNSNSALMRVLQQIAAGTQDAWRSYGGVGSIP